MEKIHTHLVSAVKYTKPQQDTTSANFNYLKVVFCFVLVCYSGAQLMPRDLLLM